MHSLKSQGFCERSHRALKEEFFSVALHKESVRLAEGVVEDLDGWLAFYNERRSHQGNRTQGRTPWQAFQDGVAAMNQPQAA
ncbi:MAG: hypothetical protein ACREKS_15885 [Candidatus Rokuibacteriota bacterium]